jgi:hypothetical protein
MTVQKFINITVGILTIAVISSALILLQKQKNSESVIITENIISTAEQNDVLAGTIEDRTKITAVIQNIETLENGNSKVTIEVGLENISDKVVQFSPPINLTLLDVTNSKTYRLTPSEQTTLFGGPVSPSEQLNGVIIVETNGLVSTSRLQLLYQPNYSQQTKTVDL